jgi:pimeloyl-ACP methyl ester carboxylesterase
VLASLAKIAAAVVVGVPLVMYLAQDALIFARQPVSDTRRADIAKRFPAVSEIFATAADGVRLHAWFVRPSGAVAAPLVIYFGGNAEEVSWMLEAIGDPGVAWLLVDYRGYGASGGSPSERALYSDATLLYDDATKLPRVDPRRIFVLGRSLGSGVAVHLASARRVAGVILVTPFDSLVSVAKSHYPWLPVEWLLKYRFDSLSLAPAIRAPLLCFVAEFDRVVDPSHAARLVAAWGGPKREVALAGTDHNNIDNAPGYWREILRFIEQPGA